MVKKFDVVIVGAGPGGLAAAKILGERRKNVLIVEKNPKIGPKICAGGLTKKTLNLGIPLSLAERVFYSVKINFKKSLINITDIKPLVATISRKKLAKFQLQQLGENVEIQTNSKAIKVKDHSILLENGEEISFDYLIGADGSLSLVRKYLQLPIQKTWIAIQYSIPGEFSELGIFFEPDKFGRGYAWLFPHKEYALFGCGCQAGSQISKNLSTNFHQWLAKKGIDFRESKLESAFINLDYRGFQFGNKFLIGDAAGLASGLTGEGIYFAIVSGQEIAKKILDQNYSLPKLKKILKIKKKQEIIGRFLMFKVLKSKTLTQFLFKRFL